MVDGSNASVFPQYNYAQAGLYPDPTQWSNPYSSFNSPGQMPGWPTGYAGAPVNAGTGQPIAGYQPPAPGTTINSTPVPQQSGQMYTGGQLAGLSQNAINQMSPNQQAELSSMPQTVYGQVGRVSGQPIGAVNTGQRIYPQQSQQSTPQIQPANASGNYQSALSALANPGNPITPGYQFNPATQTGGGAGGQGVLNNFLQNWKQGGVGQTAAPGLGGGSSGVNIAANNPFFAMMGGQK